MEHLDAVTTPLSHSLHAPQTLPSLPPPQGKNIAKQNLGIVMDKRPEAGGEHFVLRMGKLSPFFVLRQQVRQNINFWKASG